MLIRTATVADAHAITSLAGTFFAEDAGTHDRHTDASWPSRDGLRYYGAMITDPTALVLVAESDRHDVIGFLVGRQRPSDPLRPSVSLAELESMYVNPECRSMGVGQQLVDGFRVWARNRPVDLLTVTAFALNGRARGFYERLGFVAHTVTLEADARVQSPRPTAGAS